MEAADVRGKRLSWNTKGAILLARPEYRDGRKLYRVENVGDQPATHIRGALRQGVHDVTEWLQQGRVPASLEPGASFLLGLSPAFRDSAVLTLTWLNADGVEKRWHGPVSL